MSTKTGVVEEDYVDIPLNPPRTIRQYNRGYLLTAKTERDLWLPVKETTLAKEVTPDGDVATAARIPRWIAEDRGLIVKENPPDEDTMSRHDWFLLGAAMAFVMQAGPALDVKVAVWEARKLVKILMEAEQ